MSEQGQTIVMLLRAGCLWKYDGYGGDNMIVDTDATDAVMSVAAAELTSLRASQAALVKIAEYAASQCDMHGMAMTAQHIRNRLAAAPQVDAQLEAQRGDYIELAEAEERGFQRGAAREAALVEALKKLRDNSAVNQWGARLIEAALAQSQERTSVGEKDANR